MVNRYWMHLIGHWSSSTWGRFHFLRQDFSLGFGIANGNKFSVQVIGVHHNLLCIHGFRCRIQMLWRKHVSTLRTWQESTWVLTRRISSNSMFSSRICCLFCNSIAKQIKRLCWEIKWSDHNTSQIRWTSSGGNSLLKMIRSHLKQKNILVPPTSSRCLYSSGSMIFTISDNWQSWVCIPIWSLSKLYIYTGRMWA